jgi:hypothetical protein
VSEEILRIGESRGYYRSPSVGAAIRRLSPDWIQSSVAGPGVFAETFRIADGAMLRAVPNANTRRADGADRADRAGGRLSHG